MKSQRKPEPEEKQIYTIPASFPAAYEQEPSHSSKRTFFRYSDIEADPVNYELTQDFACTAYSFPVNSGLPFETGLTMEEPYAYLGSIQKHSESTGIQGPERKKKPAAKKQIADHAFTDASQEGKYALTP
ncbi:hypothetical protein MSMTP_2603 [Methanosarcina sp. MTP4]|uniref:hypothetical protein n=1 Tax=Methanosarcina sp. MTP4 TaxID=1434100 RepID=UPI000616143D|nr:hypothetical protein [Methanosarcina sp. MTP4]AKB26072.1 hypothetical protein MSMTP_2603 [Methanosarcina sp. MTP4]